MRPTTVGAQPVAPHLQASSRVARVRLLSLEELPVYAKVLVYAEPGKGKTFLGATAPDPIILLTETEVSKPTLRHAARLTGTRPKGIIIIDSLEAMDAALDYLEAGGHGAKTAVLDSATDLNRFIVREMVREGVSRRSSHDPDVPEQGDWYRIEERTRYYLRRLRDLPMHVVVICLLADIRDELIVAPALQPRRLMYEVPAYFNTVGQLVTKELPDRKGEVKRELYVESSSSRIAKNPGNALPPVIENPNLTTVFDELVAKLTAIEAVRVISGLADDENNERGEL